MNECRQLKFQYMWPNKINSNNSASKGLHDTDACHEARQLPQWTRPGTLINILTYAPIVRLSYNQAG